MTTAPPRSIFMAVGTALATLAQAGPIPMPLDLDPSFAGDGTLILEPGIHDVAHVGLIEDSGEIVVFGESDNGNASFREAIFQRIQADGTPGTIRGFDASVFGCSVPRTFLTGIRLRNGDYLGAGFVQEGCGGLPRKFNALQLAPSSELVEEYDRVVFNNERAYISALGEQSDGSIIAAGFADEDFTNNATMDVAVTRYTPAGRLDPTFGSGGIFTFDRASNVDWTNDIVIDRNDRILVAGYAWSATDNQDWMILRLTPDGALDPTFGNGGVFLYDGSGQADSAASIVMGPGGRIFAGGNLHPTAGQSDSTPVVLALDEAGKLDTNFGENGIATVDLGNDDAFVRDIHYAAWRIYVTGSSRASGGAFSDFDAAATVLKMDGEPNPFFNGGAPRVFQFDPALGPQADLPQSIEVSEDSEQIVITGYTDNESRTIQRFGVARLIGFNDALFIDGFEEPIN